MIRLFDSHTDLAEVIRELPPEHRERLTFHLPLEVQALEVVGATTDAIRDRVNRRLPIAFASSLVDPPLYRWAEQHYRPVAELMLSADPLDRQRGFAVAAPLGPGLAGGAFHALIRVGYGALRRDPAEIARGLAYLRVRRQVLFGPTAVPEHHGITLDGAPDLTGSSVFDQLDLVAGDPAMFDPTGVAAAVPEPSELAARAMSLVERDPSSFIAVHTVTALHALAELDGLITGRRNVTDVTGDPLLARWWQALWQALSACTVLVEQSVPSVPTRPRQLLGDLEQLVAAAVESCEVHDLKISVALSRLVELGLTTEPAALIVGTEKLAATECHAW